MAHRHLWAVERRDLREETCDSRSDRAWHTLKCLTQMWGAQYIRFEDSAMGMMSSHFAMLLAAQHPSLVILLPPTRIHWPSFKAEVCCLLLTRFPLPLLPLPPSPPLTTRWLLLLLLFLAVLVRPCASLCVLVCPLCVLVCPFVVVCPCVSFVCPCVSLCVLSSLCVLVHACGSLRMLVHACGCLSATHQALI